MASQNRLDIAIEIDPLVSQQNHRGLQCKNDRQPAHRRTHFRVKLRKTNTPTRVGYMVSGKLRQGTNNLKKNLAHERLKHPLIQLNRLTHLIACYKLRPLAMFCVTVSFTLETDHPQRVPLINPLSYFAAQCHESCTSHLT
jgi:hypothetical protein